MLKGTPVFSVLSDEELEGLTDRFELVHYSLGQPVCCVGDEADAFFIVYSGRARVIAENNGGEEVTVGTLTRGNSFGEQGLLTDSRRHYTVRAASDLALLRLHKTEFERLLNRHADLREYFTKYISETSIRNFLKLCTVFSPLSPDEIRDLLGSMQVIEFASGAAIIREGEAGDAFYILRSGSADVVKESDGGKVLNNLKAGDSFGELALLTGQPRAATVIAKEPSSVFRLGKSEFDHVIASSPKLKDALVSVASGYSAAAVREAEEAGAPPPAATSELLPAPPP